MKFQGWKYVPAKGDIIPLSYLGFEDTYEFTTDSEIPDAYRVINYDEDTNTIKLMPMGTGNPNSATNSNRVKTTFAYTGSALENYMTNFYNILLAKEGRTAGKTRIVEIDSKQYKLSYTKNATVTDKTIFSGLGSTSFDEYNKPAGTLTTYHYDEVSSGTAVKRSVYPLTATDIKDYFGDSAISPQMMTKFFFNYGARNSAKEDGSAGVSV